MRLVAGRRRWWALLVAAVFGAAAMAAGAAWLWWPGAKLPPIDPQDAAQVAAGQAVYAAQCARCHGVVLEGQPNWRDRLANGRLPAPPHDDSGHSWHHPDEVLFGITKHGLGPFAPPGYDSDMPAYDGVLRDDEIAAVLAYIKSRWPPEIQARQQRINEQARSQ
jgi:mono/diheme cytochrome c family protein